MAGRLCIDVPVTIRARQEGRQLRVALDPPPPRQAARWVEENSCQSPQTTNRAQQCWHNTLNDFVSHCYKYKSANVIHWIVTRLLCTRMRSVFCKKILAAIPVMSCHLPMVVPYIDFGICREKKLFPIIKQHFQNKLGVINNSFHTMSAWYLLHCAALPQTYKQTLKT